MGYVGVAKKCGKQEMIPAHAAAKRNTSTVMVHIRKPVINLPDYNT